jgi:hypothetical protein
MLLLHTPQKMYPEKQQHKNQPSRLLLSNLSHYSLKSNGHDRVYGPPPLSPPPSPTPSANTSGQGSIPASPSFSPQKTCDSHLAASTSPPSCPHAPVVAIDARSRSPRPTFAVARPKWDPPGGCGAATAGFPAHREGWGPWLRPCHGCVPYAWYGGAVRTQTGRVPIIALIIDGTTRCGQSRASAPGPGPGTVHRYHHRSLPQRTPTRRSTHRRQWR